MRATSVCNFASVLSQTVSEMKTTAAPQDDSVTFIVLSFDYLVSFLTYTFNCLLHYTFQPKVSVGKNAQRSFQNNRVEHRC